MVQRGVVVYNKYYSISAVKILFILRLFKEEPIFIVKKPTVF